MSCYPFTMFERNRREVENSEKELQNRIAKMTPDEKAKYLKNKTITDGIITLFAILLFGSVSAFFLWLFI